MLVSPDDVAADHAPLLLVAGVVGAVESEVAQGGELGLDAVEPGAVRRGVGDLHVVRLSPLGHPATLPRRRVQAVVVTNDCDAGLCWVERAQVAAELQELRPVLGLLDVPVELVFSEVVGSEQVPDSVRAGVGRPASGAGLTVGILVLAAAFGPLPSGVGLEVERPELVQAEDDSGSPCSGMTSPSAIA